MRSWVIFSKIFIQFNFIFPPGKSHNTGFFFFLFFLKECIFQAPATAGKNRQKIKKLIIESVQVSFDACVTSLSRSSAGICEHDFCLSFKTNVQIQARLLEIT